MVDGAYRCAELLELVVAADLEWSWFLSGGFEFDEGDPSSGEDDDAVGYSGGAWAGEFPAESSVVTYRLD